MGLWVWKVNDDHLYRQVIEPTEGEVVDGEDVSMSTEGLRDFQSQAVEVFLWFIAAAITQ